MYGKKKIEKLEKTKIESILRINSQLRVLVKGSSFFVICLGLCRHSYPIFVCRGRKLIIILAMVALYAVYVQGMYSIYRKKTIRNSIFHKNGEVFVHKNTSPRMTKKNINEIELYSSLEMAFSFDHHRNETRT